MCNTGLFAAAHKAGVDVTKVMIHNQPVTVAILR